MQLIMKTYQLSCPYGRIDTLVDFGMNPEDSTHPVACLQNLAEDKFQNKECSSDTYIDRTVLATWFTDNCEGETACIMNFPASQSAQPAGERFLKADVGA